MNENEETKPTLFESDLAMWDYILKSTEQIAHHDHGIFEERLSAHEKHRDHSMESWPASHPLRLPILVEEIGEVARELNEAAIRGDAEPDHQRLRSELIQVAAMAVAWVAALDREHPELVSA